MDSVFVCAWDRGAIVIFLRVVGDPRVFEKTQYYYLVFAKWQTVYVDTWFVVRFPSLRSDAIVEYFLNTWGILVDFFASFSWSSSNFFPFLFQFGSAHKRKLSDQANLDIFLIRFACVICSMFFFTVFDGFWHFYWIAWIIFQILVLSYL